MSEFESIQGWTIVLDDIYSDDGIHCVGPKLGCLGCKATTNPALTGDGVFIIALCCADCMESLVRMKA
jgi:hypothetical protein